MSLERLLASLERIGATARNDRGAPQSEIALGLEPDLTSRLLESMLLSRQLDVAAYRLARAGQGHYTISSAGHEANVVLGALTTPSDPSLIHYRSGALFVERARHSPEFDAALAIAHGLTASALDPLCSGRHKVFGSKALGVIPQTSTIASHLPRALGLAFALELKPRVVGEPSSDAIALASFGDAGLNHSTAQGALNAASWIVAQGLKLPLLLVCEDNGLGISVRSPPGWVAARLKAQLHFRYVHVDSTRLDQCYLGARDAIAYVRTARRPAVLHLSCRRLLGHAGSDADTSYRSAHELEEAERHDPILNAVELALAHGLITRAQLEQLLQATKECVEHATARAQSSPKLGSRAEVMLPLEMPAALDRDSLAPRGAVAARPGEALTLAQGINLALRQLLLRLPVAVLFGEDVAKKGGVYGVTKGLLDQFGGARVFNSLLDEQTILGLGLGLASQGLLPVTEIQYLAYLHNAEDQLRGEAATMAFFSDGSFDNPMIVRIAGLAYQKGFGGHFHNDNSLAVLRDIPGLLVAVPCRADDALALYAHAEKLTMEQRKVVVFVEPIALYHERDLYEEGDRAWLAQPPALQEDAGGGPRLYFPEASDLLLVSYGNGVRMCLRAQRTLATHGIHAGVLDLRWLAPLPKMSVLKHSARIGRVLVADECRHTGNVSEELMTLLSERLPEVACVRVASADSFIPLGNAAHLVLLSEAEIVDAALACVGHLNT